MTDKKIQKQAVVVHSGGMDSSICLALAVEKHGAENVLSMTFTYGQNWQGQISLTQIWIKQDCFGQN